MKKCNTLKILTLVIALAVQPPLIAQNKTDEVLGNSYRPDKIPEGEAGRSALAGGISALDSIFPGSYSSRLSLNANFRAGLNYQCGDLNFFNNIEAELKNLQYKMKNLIKDIQKKAMAAISGAMSGFFQYALMKINPVLGELTTKQWDEQIQLFDLKVRECRDFERDVAQGKNPLGELMEIAVGEQWKQTIGLVANKEASLEEAKEEMIKAARKNGLTMADGKNYGGEKQEPINFTKSLITSGMNLMMSRQDKSAWENVFPVDAQSIKDNPILKEFKSPKELYEFAEEIYGATEKRLGEADTKDQVKSIAGKGYEKKYVEYRNDMIKDLKEYVDGRMKRDEFEKKTGLQIPPIEVDDMRGMPPYQLSVEIVRRAREYAEKRMINNLLFIKQALKTGIRAPDLQQTAVRQPAEEEFKVMYYRVLDDIREISQRAYQY
ncbi:MAG: hypothetical protein Q4A74_02910 [Cardiobacteriaceae bacterium]|nr:hypothetical protein [Cardiobacteriaceae bacterium]